MSTQGEAEAPVKILTPHVRWCLHRAFITMIIVGPLLTVINQWERLVPFDPVWWKIVLTFAVPFAVSLSGSLPGGGKQGVIRAD